MPKESSEIVFPENSDNAINSILSKYGLLDLQKEEIKKIFLSEDPVERKFIFGNLPGFKIATLIKKFLNKNISKEEFILELKNSFELSEDNSENIFNDINELFFPLVKLSGKSSPAEKNNSEKEQNKTGSYDDKDTYREKVN